MASSLRNLGRLDESLALITDEAQRTTDPLDDAVTTVRALTLCSLGRDTEAAALAIEALAKHLPRYQRSMTAYARAILAPGSAPD